MGLKESRTLLFLKRSSSRIFILGGIMLIVALYHDHYYSKKFFHFPSKGHVVKNVSEKGFLLFSSGNKVELKNEYLSKELIKRTDSVIIVEGTTAGEFDQTLKPLIKSNDYIVEINTSEVPQACKEKFVMQYPSFLRRFIYYMPKAPLFNGKKWEIDACGGEFVCNYEITLYEKVRKVEMMCSGTIGDAEIAMSGDLEMNAKFNGFSEVILEISSESPELISSWKFSESSKTK
jgi:hypothetical protein